MNKLGNSWVGVQPLLTEMAEVYQPLDILCFSAANRTVSFPKGYGQAAGPLG